MATSFTLSDILFSSTIRRINYFLPCQIGAGNAIDHNSLSIAQAAGGRHSGTPPFQHIFVASIADVKAAQNRDVQGNVQKCITPGASRCKQLILVQPGHSHPQDPERLLLQPAS